jgi:hypothetical protein
MKIIHYSRNPGFNIPKKTLPKQLLEDLSSFVESESTDREARAMELSHLYGISVADILEQLEKLRRK